MATADSTVRRPGDLEREAAVATMVGRHLSHVPGQSEACAAWALLRYFIVMLQEGLTELYVQRLDLRRVQPCDTPEGPRAFFRTVLQDTAPLMPLSLAAVRALPAYHLAARTEGARAHAATCIEDWGLCAFVVCEGIEFLSQELGQYAEEGVEENIEEAKMNLCHVGRDLHHAHMTLVLHQDRPYLPGPLLDDLPATLRRWAGLDLETLQPVPIPTPPLPYVNMELTESEGEQEDVWEAAYRGDFVGDGRMMRRRDDSSSDESLDSFWTAAEARVGRRGRVRYTDSEGEDDPPASPSSPTPER